MYNEMRIEPVEITITRKAVKTAAEELGIQVGDTILIHSSFKSIGPIEKGAESIIGGFLDAVGENGTVVFPTLCQKDWTHVYENWHKDAPSDIGYLTNYFRKLPGAMRSDQATHSVAALGKLARYITQTHGQSGCRWGVFGDTPFAADSPWEKLYHINAKIIMLGVGIRKCTFRHYAEYLYMNEQLRLLCNQELRESFIARTWRYERWEEKGAWPHINSEFVQKILDSKGRIAYGKCGNANVMCFLAKDFVDESIKLLEQEQWEALSFDAELLAEWVNDLKNAILQYER